MLIFYFIVFPTLDFEGEMPFIDFSERSITGSLLSLDMTIISQLEAKHVAHCEW